MTRGERMLGLFASAPRYDSFYALFERAGVNVEQATALLAKLITDRLTEDFRESARAFAEKRNPGPFKGQ